MSSSHSDNFEIKPELLKLSSSTKTTFWVLVAIGVGSFVASMIASPARAWHGFLLNYYFFLCLGIGGCFFAGTQYLTKAGWSSTVRRIPESFHAWFPWAVLLFIVIVVAGSKIYGWFDPQTAAHDPLIQIKVSYLNVPFFLVRSVAFFAFWYFVGGKIVRNSVTQDKVGGIDLMDKNVYLSGGFMPGFALLFSLTSVDLIMSLDPHWFSTMFGVNCFANLFLSTIAMATIVLIRLKKAGYFGNIVNENHMHAMGLLLFAFVIFYAYVAFSQYMLIWYGNLPEETSYYLRRWEHGWSAVAITVMVFKFFVPFLMLLPREAKRKMDYLLKVSYIVLAACWIDTFWMVMPAYSKTPVIPVYEIGMFVGFLGAFLLAVTHFLEKVPLVPQKDPRVLEAVSLHS